MTQIEKFSSSDLSALRQLGLFEGLLVGRRLGDREGQLVVLEGDLDQAAARELRSEERRVGKEC